MAFVPGGSWRSADSTGAVSAAVGWGVRAVHSPVHSSSQTCAKVPYWTTWRMG